MILGGRVAAEFRHIVEGIFTRYMAGDRSMIDEIHSNAVSSAPIHQAYRHVLAQEPVLDSAGTKRHLELQMEERIMTSLNPDWRQDDRLRLQLEDSVKNAFFTPVQPLITNGEAQVPLTRSIDVSTLA